MKLLAKTLQGLEPILEKELLALGATHVETFTRAIRFRGNMETLYRVNLESRVAMRVLMPISSFNARDEEDLYRKVKRIDWSRYMTEEETLAIDGVTNSEVFTHSKYIALKSKDAIVDQFREKTGKRPNVNTASPDLRINIHIYGIEVTVSIDSSGDSLHKRGYRRETLEAPISEVLAAGMILMSGYNGDRTFIDPMCGSGTFLTEAALIASNLPAQMYRKEFGFQRWKNYRPEVYTKIYDEAMAKQRVPSHPILGFDKNFQAINVTERNMEAAGLENIVTAKRRPFERLVPPPGGGILVTNPPYGERLEEEDIEGLYQMIGDQLKKEFKDFDAWLITSNYSALKSVGLRTSARIPMYNGALECRLVKYEMYEGSRKGMAPQTEEDKAASKETDKPEVKEAEQAELKTSDRPKKEIRRPASSSRDFKKPDPRVRKEAASDRSSRSERPERKSFSKRSSSELRKRITKKPPKND